MEIWNLGVARPRGAASDAQRLEEAGWSGLALVDSQNLSGDVYVALTVAAGATHRIGLGPGVTNPATRQAATTACAIASVQRIANGRAVMAIGRGDSALAHLGRSPARLAWFERYVLNLRRYLDGEPSTFGAYLNCACHRSLEVAREIVRGGVTTHARFSVMHGQVAGPASEQHREVLPPSVTTTT